MKVQNNILRLLAASAGAILLSFGVNGKALAVGCVGDAGASGTILVDATTSCAAIGQDGCRVEGNDMVNGEACCDIPNSGGARACARFTVDGDKTTGIKWYLQGTEYINWVLTGGATQGGACGTIFDPGILQADILDSAVYGFIKRDPDTFQATTYVDFCTKHEVPPAGLRLVKRVVAEDADGNLNCENAVKSLDLEISEPVDIKYCYSVSNLGDAPYTILLLNDDMGTPGDTGDDLVDIDIGPLGPAGDVTGTKVYESSPITISRQGTIVNTATVEGTDSQGRVASAEDTATVNVELAPVECDVLTVVDTNNQQIQNKYLFWYGVPSSPGAPAVCVNTVGNPDTSNYPRARRNRCVDDCVLKPECENPPSGSTGPGGICEQVCQPSGAWTEHAPATATNPYACLGAATNVPGNLYPYCWEIQQDLDRDCGLNEVHPTMLQETYGEQTSTNPYVYKQCTKQGGRKVCEVYCYLYDGEDASACPDTSTVITN